jgi:hypothetical protein
MLFKQNDQLLFKCPDCGKINAPEHIVEEWWKDLATFFLLLSGVLILTVILK